MADEVELPPEIAKALGKLVIETLGKKLKDEADLAKDVAIAIFNGILRDDYTAVKELLDPALERGPGFAGAMIIELAKFASILAKSIDPDASPDDLLQLWLERLKKEQV